MESPYVPASLNTSYVSLAALIRYLRENDFTGRLHVALDQYEADVFLYGKDAPSVWEKDLKTGVEAQGEDAQQRLMVRSREPGGQITIYQGTSEKVVSDDPSAAAVLNSELFPEPVNQTNDSWLELIDVSGEVIAAVERATNSAGTNFTRTFRQARVELGDDYPLVDPTVGGFDYADGEVVIKANTSAAAYVQVVTRTLERVVERTVREHGEIFRERVAVELATAARRFDLKDFAQHVDQIAGTRVL